MRLTARGGAPPELAWSRYADLDAWCRWAPQIRAVRAPSRALRPGLAGTVAGPLGVSASFTVLAVDAPAMTWVWRVHLDRSPITVVMHHAVTPWQAGCRTTLDLRGPAPVCWAYAPVAQLALHRLVAS